MSGLSRQAPAGPSPRCECEAARVSACRSLAHGRGARSRRLHTVRVYAWTWPHWPQEKLPEKPALPRSTFSKEDLKRIKAKGPTLEDVTVHIETKQLAGSEDGEPIVKNFTFVPPGVIGDKYYNVMPEPEPKWEQLPEMPSNLFMQGIRERNWTHDMYDPAAKKWTLKVWKCRKPQSMFNYWPETRIVIEEEGMPTRWSALHPRCPETRIHEYLAGRSHGAPFKWPRGPIHQTPMGREGPDQFWEQVFEAFEEKPPGLVRETFSKQTSGWDMFSVPRQKLGMNDDIEKFNPGMQKLDLYFRATPLYIGREGFYARIPQVFSALSVIIFVFSAVLLGIFRTSKGRAPKDLQEAMEYAQSKAKARKDGSTGVTLDDVAGMKTVIADFEEIVSFLRDPGMFTRSGVRPPKGVLLAGPPGVGKTMIAKAIAGSAEVGFYQMAGSEFVEAIVGVGAARVRDLFRRAAAYKTPTLIFVDEIDALGTHRAKGDAMANEEREQTLNQLLTEIDGFTPQSSVVFIAATNRPGLLDPALVRPGRFDRTIEVPRPDAEARYEILKVHARKMKLSEDCDLQQVANDVPGLVGADLANLLNEAAIAAVKAGTEQIHPRHLLEATDRILKGDIKRRHYKEDELHSFLERSYAVHEAGKALWSTDVRQRTGLGDEIEKVSVVPRGTNVSRTVFKRGSDENYTFVTKREMQQKIRFLLAGAAAAEVLETDLSTYCNADLKEAREKAEIYVQNYCMSDLGLVSYAKKHALDRGFREGKLEVSDLLAAEELEKWSKDYHIPPRTPMYRKMEEEQFKIIAEAWTEVKERLTELRPQLAHLTEQLFEAGELNGDQVVDIVNGPGVNERKGTGQLYQARQREAQARRRLATNDQGADASGSET